MVPTGRPVRTVSSAEAAGQPILGVARVTVDAYLEVEVVAGGGAGAADTADHLTAADPPAVLDEDRRLVAVAGADGPAVLPAVAEARVVAVAIGPAGAHDPAVGRGVDRAAGAGGEVEAGVQSPDPVHRVEAHAERARLPAVQGHQQPGAGLQGGAAAVARLPGAQLGGHPRLACLREPVLGERRGPLGRGGGDGVAALGGQGLDGGARLLRLRLGVAGGAERVLGRPPGAL